MVLPSSHGLRFSLLLFDESLGKWSEETLTSITQGHIHALAGNMPDVGAWAVRDNQTEKPKHSTQCVQTHSTIVRR